MKVELDIQNKEIILSCKAINNCEGITIHQIRALELKEWKKNDLRNKEYIQSLRKIIERLEK